MHGCLGITAFMAIRRLDDSPNRNLNFACWSMSTPYPAFLRAYRCSKDCDLPSGPASPEGICLILVQLCPIGCCRVVGVPLIFRTSVNLQSSCQCPRRIDGLFILLFFPTDQSPGTSSLFRLRCLSTLDAP
ncbi:hypothetical protein GALMADRAFT_481022 [Galerina marginata CBS 339.88]|uniref:Uncharacterized protein n=1 Tax=Galerina marginata (strain CBS 339.88) TaxID=685588 RepID=A0A067SZT3_GALM3|nr:hypothetical protein GALMADRAFT_481022 [Galerina marginata CBS 339.88]